MSRSIKSNRGTKTHVIGKVSQKRHDRRAVKSALKLREFDEDTVMKPIVRKIRDKYRNFFKRYLAS